MILLSLGLFFILILFFFVGCIIFYDNRWSFLQKQLFLKKVWAYVIGILFLFFLFNVSNNLTVGNIFKMIVIFFILVWLCISKTELINPLIFRFEYYLFIFFSIFGAIGIIYANHWIVLYISIEIFSVCLYGLIAFFRKSHLVAEASLKYATLNALGTAFLLFGVVFIYGHTTILSLKELSFFLVSTEEIFSYQYIWIGIIFIYLALFFKLAAAPLHFWLPDVYEGSLNITLSYLSLISKVPILAFMIRFTYYINDSISYTLHYLFLLIGALSIFLGAAGAFEQHKLKRFFAYSSITHFGYLFLGLSFGSRYGHLSILLYLFIYICSTVALLGCFMIYFEENIYLKPNMYAFSGIYLKEPIIGMILILILLSYIGLPPLGGFYAKYYIFLSLAQKSIYMILLLYGLLSVFSAAYYIRLIKIISFNSLNVTIQQSTNLEKNEYDQSMSLLYLSKFKNYIYDVEYIHFFYVTFFTFIILNFSFFIHLFFSFVQQIYFF